MRTTILAACIGLVLGLGSALAANSGVARTYFTLSSITNDSTPVVTGNGVTGAGSLRVTVASDNTPFTVISNAGTGTSSVNVAQINGTTTGTGNGIAGAGTQRVTIASDNTAFSVNANLSQVNGTTTSTGNGIAGAGVQRVTIASDNTAFSVNNTQVGTASQNVAQFGGTNVSTGTGASGAGIPRVTVSNDSSILGTKTNNAAAPGATNFGALPALANAANPTWTEGNLVLQSVDLAGRQRANLSAVGGTATVSGGLAGTLGVGGTQANNTAITANPILTGIEAQTGQPTAATTGNIRQAVGSVDGVPYVRFGGPVPWTCSLDGIGATLTQCQAAPGAGLKLYLTDLVINSTTATTSNFLVRYGTGANCGTGTTSLLPAAATVVRFTYPSNTAAPLHLSFYTPLSAAANNAICILCTNTNTCVVTMTGFIAP
jgi:hypothetical protein